jgi:putative PIN family toxin of toxin-antitoxin system
MNKDENTRLRVVLDTNIVLVSLTSHSRWHGVYRALAEGGYSLIVSNEIMSEYAEKILSKYDRATAENFLRSLLTLPNVEFQEIYYRWNLIEADADDNKFVDCAIAASVDCVVSEDRHFDVLSEVPFPAVRVMKLAEFVATLSSTKRTAR